MRLHGPSLKVTDVRFSCIDLEKYDSVCSINGIEVTGPRFILCKVLEVKET